MSEERDLAKEELERELAEERALNARVHKYMGMTAAVLGIVATIVALARMRAIFGISPWEALGIGATTIPWLLLILGLGVVFSLGTSRLALGLSRLQAWLKRRA